MNTKERIAALRERIENPEKKQLTTRQKIIKTVKKVALYGSLLAALPTWYFSTDYLTKRQNYPERNVLFRSSNITTIAGNQEGKLATRSDRDSATQFYRGGNIESKIGTFLCRSNRELRGDIEFYNLNNSQDIRIASATQKPERFQAGLRLNGSMNFREQFAEIVSDQGKKAKRNYAVYKFAPERGFIERDVDVVENEDGKRVVYNRLSEPRNIIGWFLGKHPYRAGTLLEDYAKDEENEKLGKKFLENISKLDSQNNIDTSFREKLVNELIDIEDNLKKETIYSTFEDGYLKAFYPGSTTYLGYNPSLLERIKHRTGFGRKDHVRLRVENQWDLWPGRLPLLSEFSIGRGEDKLYPFDKTNNGGYTIHDKYGELAKIEIRDFILKYGQDMLYLYYVDLNGDGVIDKEKELIGEVLCKTTHDERMEIHDYGFGKKPDNDITVTINYSFMSPTSDMKKGMEYFKLCAYVETLMPDQIHKGYGRDSLLKLINDQRSDLLLYNDLSLENLSRTLTQESTLVAKYDIIHLLNAAKRPYSRELAKTYNIEKEFKDFQDVPLTYERFELPEFPMTALEIGAIGLGLWYGRKKLKQIRENKILAKKERMDKLKAKA